MKYLRLIKKIDTTSYKILKRCLHNALLVLPENEKKTAISNEMEMNKTCNSSALLHIFLVCITL